MSTRPHEDAARFEPHDPSALVAAAFACPYCLGLPSSMQLESDDPLPAAVCRCEPCDAAYTIYVDDLQAMRLALAPPLDLPRPILRATRRGHPS